MTADHVVVPLAPDLYSLEGLRNLGPTLKHDRSLLPLAREARKNRRGSKPGNTRF